MAGDTLEQADLQGGGRLPGVAVHRRSGHRRGPGGLLRRSRGARLPLRQDAPHPQQRRRRDLDRPCDHQQHSARRPRCRHHRAGLGHAGDELVHGRDLGTHRPVPGARSLGAGADRRVGPPLQQAAGRDTQRLARELDAALDRRRAHLGAARAEHRLRPARTGAGLGRRAAVRRHGRGGRPRRGAACHFHRRGAVVASRRHRPPSRRLPRRAPAVHGAARRRAGRRGAAVYPPHGQRRGRNPLLPLQRPRAHLVAAGADRDDRLRSARTPDPSGGRAAALYLRATQHAVRPARLPVGGRGPFLADGRRDRPAGRRAQHGPGYPASAELAPGELLTVYYQVDRPGEKASINATRWSLGGS